MQLRSVASTSWVLWARRLFIPLALGFLAYSAFRAGGDLSPLLADVSLKHLLWAWICWVAAQWIGPLVTMALVRMMKVQLGWREIALISILRLPAKYLPGGIWQSVSRFTAYNRHDVRKADSFAILVAEHLLALGISTLFGGTLLTYTATAPLVAQVGEGVLVGSLVLLSGTVIWLVRRARWRIGSLVPMAAGVAATALFWSAATASFCAYWVALFDMGNTDLLRVASAYLLSWAAGLIAVFAPQGIGVFEWVAAQLLSSTQPVSVIVTAVAGFRLVMVTADLSAWVLGMIVSRTTSSAQR